MRDIFATFAIWIEKLLGVSNPPAHILCFHSVSNTDSVVSVKPSQFKRYIRYILEKFEVVTLTQLIESIDSNRFSKKPLVALTFDDGYQNLLSIAPYLHSLGIRPAVFVTARPSAVNRQELDNRHPLMKMSDVRRLYDTYSWEIGSHTITHPNLLKLNDHDLEAEIIQSKHILERDLKIKVEYFAYPKGYFNSKIMDVCARAKYRAAFTTHRTRLSSTNNRYAIGRLGIDRTTTSRTFPFMFTQSALIYFGAKQAVEKGNHFVRSILNTIKNLSRNAYIRRIRI